MKLINTIDAVGCVICHDMTQIIPGVTKDARFRKGHIITEEDIPVLLSIGKEHIYVWEKEEGMLHEDEAAVMLANLCSSDASQVMHKTTPKEGKIELISDVFGLFKVDAVRLEKVNMQEELMIATRHTNTVVHPGDKLAGTRIIPLVIAEEKLQKALSECGEKPLLDILPFRLKTAALITTGSEVKKGRIKDAFTPVIIQKLKNFGVSLIDHQIVGDESEEITAAIRQAKAKNPDFILCTGGMSVDPDDRTPKAIKDSGANIVSYGAPVLPGAMFLLGYFEDNTPIMGLPGCVMYAKATVFDLLLPRILAGEKISRADIVKLGHGGLCLGCEVCHFPYCQFGK